MNIYIYISIHLLKYYTKYKRFLNANQNTVYTFTNIEYKQFNLGNRYYNGHVAEM